MTIITSKELAVRLAEIAQQLLLVDPVGDTPIMLNVPQARALEFLVALPQQVRTKVVAADRTINVKILDDRMWICKNLSTHIYNGLRNNHVDTVRDILRLTTREVSRIPSLGPSSLKILLQALANEGFFLQP